MKRDWDLVRKILMAIEAREDDPTRVCPDDIDGYDATLIAHHMKILLDAGWIEADVTQTIGYERITATGLTWAGYDFLDKVRQETLWNAIKKGIRQKSMEITGDMIVMSAKQVLEGMF